MNLSSYIDGLEKRAAEEIKAEQGDFILDGLLHCGKCGTPKQVRVKVFDKERTPFCICKCEKEKRDREETERTLREQIRRNRRICFPEEKMLSWTFENDDKANPEISQAMKNYAENFDELCERGKGLLLFGPTGTGKSYFAASIANALLDKGYPVLMTNFVRIESALSKTWDKQSYYDSLNSYPLLIIDDFAAERKTDYMGEIVFNVIDSRDRAGLPLIVTTNLTGKEMQCVNEMQYKRAISRLYEMTVPVKVEGADRRVEILKTDFTPIKELLGL